MRTPRLLSMLLCLVVLVAFARSSISYAGEMLRSDTNPTLAINALNGASEGATVGLSGICQESNPDCTWTFKDGMIVSDRNPNLAVNATNGARHLGELHLTSACTPDNPDCTWKYQRGRLISDRDPSLAINAFNGAQNGIPLKLFQNCAETNSDCTWSIFRIAPATSPGPTTEQCSTGSGRSRCICECNRMPPGPQKTACLNLCPL